MTSEARSPAGWPAEFRAALAGDRDLGAGNFFQRLRQVAPDPERPLLWCQRALPGTSATPALSVAGLGRLADRLAGFYYERGVRRRDPVALYLNGCLEPLLHFIALSGLGAIPVLLNGALDRQVAVAFVRRINAIGLVTEAALQAEVEASCGPSLTFVTTMERALDASSRALPPGYPFRHVDEDPVLLTHSSGTTGVPKAVLMQHRQFFAAVRCRLGLPLPSGADRVLSALPSAHNSAITLSMLALLNGTPMFMMADRDARSVLRSIAEFRPSMVAAFPQTYVAICEEDLDQYDLSSVELWYNSGDAAHEVHVRKLVARGRHLKASRRGREWRKGSRFVDGLGSSEMGHSLFHVTRGPDSTNYARCIGRPMPFVEAVVLDDEGNLLGPHRVGKLGVRSPTVTPGYWNDSDLTWRSRLRGYWLTGDLVYRDDEGYFYHLDRVTDVICTAAGALYSCQAEELLLSRIAELSDCSIVGIPSSQGHAEAVALAQLAPGKPQTEAGLLAEMNKILAEHRLPPLSRLIITEKQDLPIGVTGKVRKRALREQLSTPIADEASAR